MRHQKHKNQLGVKKEHRAALMANLASALIREGRIQTTLKKAKALRPFAERLVTLAKKGGLANRRLAMSRIRDKEAVQMLFNERVGEFTNRVGGYTRIYKLGTPRLGDAAEMAIIEWVAAEDPGYGANKRKARPKKAAETPAKAEKAEESAEVETATAEGEASAESEEPKASAEADTGVQQEAPAEDESEKKDSEK